MTTIRAAKNAIAFGGRDKDFLVRDGGDGLASIFLASTMIWLN